MGKCRLWVNVAWVNVAMGICRMGLCRLTVSFGQIMNIAYFGLIFGRFPFIKSQNQNPMVLLVNFWDKTLIFGVWFPYIQRQLDLSGWVTKTNFAFLGTPYIPHESLINILSILLLSSVVNILINILNICIIISIRLPLLNNAS